MNKNNIEFALAIIKCASEEAQKYKDENEFNRGVAFAYRCVMGLFKDWEDSLLMADEYAKIHLAECKKYKNCTPKCYFWGLCEEKAIPLTNINNAICVAEDIKEGVLKDETN